MKTLTKILLICCIGLCNIPGLRAGVISEHYRVEASLYSCPSLLIANTTCSTGQVTLPSASATHKDYDVEDIITLGIDHNDIAYLPDTFSCQVVVYVKKWDSANTLTTFKDTLHVRYTPFTYTTYLDKNAFVFHGGYSFTDSIISITTTPSSLYGTDTLPVNVYLDADINVKRYFDFTTNALTAVSVNPPDSAVIDCGSVADEVNITWSPVVGAEQYDLEWTYVNDYADNDNTGHYLTSSQVDYDFRHNATRITTTNSNYSITLANEHGYIVYRVRGVGVDIDNPSVYVTGVWSLSSDHGTVSSASPDYYHVVYPHEADNKDWQYNATYAEEGKKKEVITYYDGSLRSREAVTKMNSDSNVLVGQTIYDYQGRPSVTVLPVPVKFPTCSPGLQPAIHYYPDFNLHDSVVSGTAHTRPYSRLDFDRDNSDSCTIGADSMSVFDGASNYYSPDNPRKQGFQAYVPDAHGYPFSQVQYTPDNTGRIRTQGGVGPQFQLGGGHETKYIYGQPNQLELDRMYGSEVGNATHYKKNVVIDPNGQASVSYLDQEGRTVATCLAGDPGTDSSGNYTLAPLPSQSGAAVQLNVDLFAKDANGHSDNNTVSINGNSIVYNSQLTVGYSSSYRFHYSLQVDTLGMPCSSFCINCVYDLQIRVTNDCGKLMTANNDSNPTHKTVGNFTTSGDSVFFTPLCSPSHLYTDTDGFVLNLAPGNYTVSKTLTVDSAALNYYTKLYLDSANNTCLKTLNDFKTEAMAVTDTCNCHITCAGCVASLGTRDAFVANGKGTAEQYDFLYDQCTRPCRSISPCEEIYDQMLGDMSPGGQYGQFIDTVTGNIDPSVYRLSVFNSNNKLAANLVSGTGTWQHPKVTLNGHTYPYYIDDLGNRSEVNLTPLGNNSYLPHVVDSTDTVHWIRHDLTTGAYYTYPENLKYFSDFKQFWQASWAQSLIVYHPEYSYDTICMQFNNVQTGDTMSSEIFDERMKAAKTFTDAQNAGFIIADSLTGSIESKRRVAYFFKMNSRMYDPFLNDSIYMKEINDAFNLDHTFENTYDNYLRLNSDTILDMVSTAAMTARCGTYYGTSGFDTACMHFGTPFTGNVTMDDSIYSKEWVQFKNYYLSAKQALQFRMMDYAAVHVSKSYCGCIGDNSYNMCSNGMCSGSPVLYSYISQPCGSATASLYVSKQRRFVPPSAVNVSQNDADYQYYLQTGQCPVAGELQGFLSYIAQGLKFKDIHDTLNTNPGFTPDIYEGMVGSPYPATPVQMQWSFQDTSLDGNTLQANIEDLSSAVYCQFTLDKTGANITSWNQIKSFQSIQFAGNVGGEDQFTIYAAVLNPPDSVQPYSYRKITGQSCISIHNCQFAADCRPNQLSVDLSNLMGALGSQGMLNAGGVNLEVAPYKPLLTPTIINTLGTPNGALMWSFVSGNEFDLYDNTEPSKKIKLYVSSFVPNTFPLVDLNTIYSMDSVMSGGANLFTMQGLDVNGNPLVTINGEATLDSTGGSRDLSMGSCGLPTPAQCQGIPYSNVPQLDSLLLNVLPRTPYTGDIDITTSPYFAPQIAVDMPGTLDSTASKEDSTTVSGIYYDTITFRYYVTDSLQRFKGIAYLDSSGQCPFYISHIDSGSTPHQHFSELMTLTGLTGVGDVDANGDYEDFMAVATYRDTVTGVFVYYTDTIRGHSCIPLLNCQSCTGPQQTAVTYVPPDTSGSGGGGMAPLFAKVIKPKPGGDYNFGNLHPVIAKVIDKDITLPHDSTEYWTSFIPSSPYMLIGVPAPENPLDTPYAHVERLQLYDSLHNLIDTAWIMHESNLPLVLPPIRLDSTKTYYLRVQRYNEVSCPVCNASTSYFRLLVESWGFVDPVDSCSAIALGPNLIYNGDFETVPPFATSTTCYQDHSPVYTDSPAPSYTNGYPINSTMRFDYCDVHTFLYHALSDMGDAYEVTDTLSTTVFKTGAHSGKYFLALFPRTIFCSSCNDTDSTAVLYTPSNMSVAWRETAQTAAGKSYRFSCWLRNIDTNNFSDRYPGTIYVLINDTLYYSVMTVNSIYKNWHQISFCWKAPSDTAQIKLVIQGVNNTALFGLDVGVDDISFNEELPPPCSTFPDTTVSPLYTQLGNPCVTQLVNNANYNATTAYTAYLDSIITDFRTRYMKHCLAAAEGFNMLYTDKQYHYTLYYYDQAGNLIRTVPPQGTQLLSITSYTDAQEQQIIRDRTFGLHTVMTDHVLSSDYVYNSLNQLVKQSVPDDDNMDNWQFNLPLGLDGNMTVTGVQFVDASMGYLSGYDKLSSGLKRGLIYKTHDAGHTWQQVPASVGVALNRDVFLTNTSTGFAVGNGGIVMVTNDKSNSWDIIPLFTEGITEDLHGVAYDSVDNLVGIVGTSVSFSIDNATGYPYYASTGLDATDTMTSITWNRAENAFYAVGDSSGYGVMYKGIVSSHVISWTKQHDNIKALPVYKIQFTPTNTSHGFAAGLNGLLMHTTDAGQHWYMVGNKIRSIIRNIYFINDNVGVALIDSVPHYGQIYQTSDGGHTWKMISTPGKYYYNWSFYLSQEDNAYKGFAVGYGGIMTRIVTTNSLPSPYFGLININGPSSYNLRAVSAMDTGGGKVSLITAGESHHIYYTYNAANAPLVSWDSINTNSNYTDAYIAPNKTKGILGALTTTTKLICSIVNDDHIPATLSVDSSVYSGAGAYGLSDYAGSGSRKDSVFFYDNNYFPVYQRLHLLDTAVHVSPAGTYLKNGGYVGDLSSPYPTLVSDLAYIGGNKITGVDSASENIYSGTVTSLQVSWSDVSANVHPLALNDIYSTPAVASAHPLYTVGNNGTVFTDNFSPTDVFTMANSQTRQNLNAVVGDENYPVYMMMAGDSGTLLVGQAPFSLGYNFTNLNTLPGIANIKLNGLGITYNAYATYAVGNNGTGYYITHFTYLHPYVSATYNPGSYLNLLGVATETNGPAIAVGTNTEVLQLGGTSGTPITSVYNPGFNALHFMNVNDGYVVGDSGTIRRTDDGGSHWQLVIPEINGHGVPSFKSVWTTATGNAIVVGNGNFIGQAMPDNKITHTGNYSYLGASGTQWNKVRFNSGHLDSGYVVGTGDSIKTILVNKTTGNFSLVHAGIKDPVTSDLQSIHVYRDNSFMVVGTNDEAGYYYPSSSAWTDLSPNTVNSTTQFTNFTWNDVYFRDDRTCWVVGDSLDGSGNPVAGEVLKTIIPVNIQVATPSQVLWIAQPVEDGLSAKSIVTNPQQILYNAIAASSPYDLFVGGSYSGAPPSNTQNYPYARLVNDQGGQFSNLFWYDRAGHVIINQNTKQHNYSRPAFSYTLYDNLNRVIESGQKTENTDTANTINKIYGDTVMGFYNPNVISNPKYLTWIRDNTGQRTEVVHNYYDIQDILPTSVLTQQELRNRLATATYMDTLRSDSIKYNNATHYSYDVHGLVATLIQDDSVSGIAGQRYKRADYQYDIISRNVNEIDYQSGNIDQYHSTYQYDADNRLTQVNTSMDSINWDKDANYFYYADGRLARTEIGDQQVQGVDFAYTLQGWLKGVNSDLLDSNRDMGHDGLEVSGNLNRYFARDAIGFTAKYFKGQVTAGIYGDYDAINKTTWNNNVSRFEARDYNSDLMNARHDLFNGNIGAMVTDLQQPQKYSKTNPTQNAIALPQGTAYNYDQLNRLIDMKAYQNIDTDNVWGLTGSYSGLYHNWLTYDENGNINTQKRADQLGNVFDSLTYRYNNNNGAGPTLQNRLYHVNDAIAGSVDGITDDIRDEGTFNSNASTINQKNNYRYNAIGELSKDSINLLDTIIWTKYQKVWKIKKYNGDSILFAYDANGDRVSKEYKPASGTPVTTFYVRDAKGNILAIYTKSVVGISLSYVLTERDIYGDGRIGTEKEGAQLINPLPMSQVDTFSRYLGDKNYELSNHLGNVLAVVSDRKIPRPDLSGMNVDHYEPDIMLSEDYYGFGMVEPARKFLVSYYNYGFNGKLKDDDIYGTDNSYDYGSRLFDPRLGRFLSTDPEFRSYPQLSTYQFASDQPIWAIDMNGLEAKLSFAGRGQVNDPDNQTWYSNSDIRYFQQKANSLTSLGFSPNQVQTGGEFLNIMKNATKKEGSISAVVSYAHGGYAGIFLNDNGGFYTSDHTANAKPGQIDQKNLDDLTIAVDRGEVNFSKDAVWIVASCNANYNAKQDDKGTFNAQPGDFGYDITKATGVTAIGATGSVGPEIVNGKETGKLYTEGTFLKTEKVYDVTTTTVDPYTGQKSVRTVTTSELPKTQAMNQEITERIVTTNLGHTVDPKDYVPKK